MLSSLDQIFFHITNLGNFIELHPSSSLCLFSIGLIISFHTIPIKTIFHELGHAIAIFITYKKLKKKINYTDTLNIEIGLNFHKIKFKYLLKNSDRTNAYTKSKFRNHLIETKEYIEQYKNIIFGGFLWGNILILLLWLLCTLLFDTYYIYFLIIISGINFGWIFLNTIQYFAGISHKDGDRYKVTKIKEIKKLTKELSELKEKQKKNLNEQKNLKELSSELIKEQIYLQAKIDGLSKELNTTQTEFYNTLKDK